MEEDLKQPDIDFILQAIDAANAEGLLPEQILTPDELALYEQYSAKTNIETLGHYDNLVDVLDDTEVRRLATDIINWVRWDEDSRKDWSKREQEGIRALGVSDKRSGAERFKGASTVTHPLLAEAVTQFHARAIAEIWPPEGPVKGIVLGDKSSDRLEQALRVEEYMNYQYTESMPGAFEEEDNLVFRLPISGSVFKKVYYDPLKRVVCSRMVEPADFIVPYSATDLCSTPRYTHRLRQSYNTVKRLVAQGYYADANLSEPVNESAEFPEVLDEIDIAEGKQRVGQDDNRTTILECYCELNLKGMEDPDGIALPYIVWVSRDDQAVLRIQRNYKPDDELKLALVNFAHYRFMPGLGFYGFGLLHLIGGMAQSATGTLQALMDSAAFSNMQGGYRTRDSRVPGGDTAIAPGEWREVDCSAEELAKSFFPLPYKEPSDTLFELLGYLDERAQKFVGTTDVMTGDANPNAPVGTTLALIEQGGKSFSAVLRRLHMAHREEFRIVARLNSEYLPEDGYPYYSKSGQKLIMAQDFDDRVDVIPVSDPNIISNSQRIVQAQAVVDLAEKHPDQINMQAALRRMLEAIRVTNIEELLKVDESMAQTQAQLAQIEVQIKQAELAKLQSEKLKIDADRTESVMRGLFSAMQAANMVAANPAIAPISDEIYKSGGGIDYNGFPIVNAPAQAMPVAPMPKNTSPNFPANPESPGQGANAGIETMQNETLQ